MARMSHYSLWNGTSWTNFEYISDAAQAWADEPRAVIYDNWATEKYGVRVKIEEDDIKSVLGW